MTVRKTARSDAADRPPVRAEIQAPAQAQPTQRPQKLDPAVPDDDRFGRVKGSTPLPRAPVAPSLASRIVELPTGYPPAVDLGALARAAKEILIGQGLDESAFAGVKRLLLTDADLTLFDSPVIPVLLRHNGTKDLLLDPETKEPMRFGIGPERDVMKEYGAKRAAHPEIPWAEFKPEPAQVSFLANILAAKEILPTINSVKKANSDGSSREIVVTARGGDDSVVAGIRQLLGRHGAEMDGAVMLYHPVHREKLHLGDDVQGQGRKKALAMAALLTLFDPASAQLKRVRFMDDNDENLIRAMELLPKLFPHVRFEFLDVIHTGGGKFEPRVVARSQVGGAIKDASGKLMSAEAIAAYKSKDVPLPPPIVQE